MRASLIYSNPLPVRISGVRPSSWHKLCSWHLRLCSIATIVTRYCPVQQSHNCLGSISVDRLSGYNRLVSYYYLAKLDLKIWFSEIDKPDNSQPAIGLESMQAVLQIGEPFVIILI